MKVYKGTIMREFPAPNGLILEVSAGSGDVEIREHAEETVQIALSYEIRSWKPGAAELESELRANPPVKLVGKQLQIGPSPSRVSLDYRITVPMETAIQVRAGSGDLSLHSLSGHLEAVLGSGDVDGKEIEGVISLKAGSGDISLAQSFGAFHIQTGSGDINGHSLRGNAELETGSGDVNLADFHGDLRAISGSGDIIAEGAVEEDSSWFVRTSSGDVQLILPKEAQFQLMLAADFGDFNCEFPFTVEEQGKGRLRGRVGEHPRAKVEIETASGDVRIRVR